MNIVVNEHSHPYLVDFHVHDIPVKMELDTGAAVSIIISETFELVTQSHPELALTQAENKLKTYYGQDIQVLKVASLNIRKDVCLSIHVVSGAGPNLLGRDLITAIEVNLQDLKHVGSLDLFPAHYTHFSMASIPHSLVANQLRSRVMCAYVAITS